MCQETESLLVEYMDAVEEYDRRHLMFLSAARKKNREAMTADRRLLHEAEFKMEAARCRFQTHQRAHDCYQVMQFAAPAMAAAACC